MCSASHCSSHNRQNLYLQFFSGQVKIWSCCGDFSSSKIKYSIFNCYFWLYRQHNCIFCIFPCSLVQLEWRIIRWPFLPIFSLNRPKWIHQSLLKFKKSYYKYYQTVRNVMGFSQSIIMHRSPNPPLASGISCIVAIACCSKHERQKLCVSFAAVFSKVKK